MVAVYDIRKFPKQFQISFWILGALGFCAAVVMFFLFFSGPHLKPDSFAVDSEERVYLSFLNGVYLAEGDRFYPVLKGTQQSATITISDDDVMYVADRGDYTAIDLKRSVPEEGFVDKQTISAHQVGGLFESKWHEKNQTDEQGGITYRYKETLFDYEIVRENDSGEHLLFRMPRSEYLLNMIAEIGFALFMLSIAVFVATAYHYASKHQERVAKTSFPRQRPKN